MGKYVAKVKFHTVLNTAKDVVDVTDFKLRETDFVALEALKNINMVTYFLLHDPATIESKKTEIKQVTSVVLDSIEVLKIWK